MGADIHILIEISRDGGETWVLDQHHVPRHEGGFAWYATANGNRHYDMFGLLAGVRGSKLMFEPRGIPDDASELTKTIWDNQGEHTPSWLTLQEFKQAARACGYSGWTKCRPYGFNDKDYGTAFFKQTGEWPSYKHLIAYCDKLLNDIRAEHILLGDKNKPQLRFVFWFDS